jgi:hypothetical protein
MCTTNVGAVPPPSPHLDTAWRHPANRTVTALLTAPFPSIAPVLAVRVASVVVPLVAQVLAVLVIAVLVAAFTPFWGKSGVPYFGLDSRRGAGGGSFRKSPDGRWGEVVAKIPNSTTGFQLVSMRFLVSPRKSSETATPPPTCTRKIFKICYPSIHLHHQNFQNLLPLPTPFYFAINFHLRKILYL